MNDDDVRRAGGLTDRSWRVGELAEQTGLTVRALHHYDEIGLLRPSERSGTGHRRYTAADVRRLHRILALREFGVPLGEIAGVLQGQGDPRELLARQLAQVEERIAVALRLRGDLRGVLAALGDAVEPSAATLINIIEGMTTMNRPLTPEELHEMNERRRRVMEELAPEEREAMAARRRQWRESMSEEELAEANRRRAALLPPS